MESSSVAHQSPALPERYTALHQHAGWAQRASAAFHTLPLQKRWATPAVRGLGHIRRVTRWAGWLVVVALIAYFTLPANAAGHEAIDWVALAVRTLMIGSIGLVVETVIEMRLMPWRFLG